MKEVDEVKKKYGGNTSPKVRESPLNTTLEPILINEERSKVRSLTGGEEVEFETVRLDEFGNELN